jgi:hypothetical protein
MRLARRDEADVEDKGYKKVRDKGTIDDPRDYPWEMRVRSAHI